MKLTYQFIPGAFLAFVLGIATTFAQPEKADYNTFIQGAEKVEGFFTFYKNTDTGKILLEVDHPGEEFLFYTTYARGVGANDVGIDRGSFGSGGKVVKFEKAGDKLLLQERNLAYRATGNHELEKRAVEESFASSVLFGFKIIARQGDKYLIDLTPFLLRDSGAARAIKRAGQGDFNLDESRSGLFFDRTKSFPKNTEFEAIITLAGKNPGYSLRRVVPSPEYVTLHQHFSFVQLPDPGYTPRMFDPRIGYFGITYDDYSAPIEELMTTRLISRHRLIKKYPEQAVSEPVDPIVYYIDNGAPELIRNALMEGAAWWNEAFEAAGFKNAFQVKVLPADADPSDIRYNVVQWVHRSTRGWSYGSSIVDPRTGEILKGEVTLDSRRIRQDYLIARGLLGDFDSGADQHELSEIALARIRQLSAHELGHTLGLAHNFIGSIHNRASVMDYPAPKVDIKNGKLDLSDAYDKGIGAFDKTAVNWGYREFPSGTNERDELNKIVKDAVAQGFEFLTDQDARPLGSVHPQTHLWDNGADVHREFEHVLEVRKTALRNFDEKRIPEGTPFANLEEPLVPTYMFHRFMTEAVAKSLGGAYYSFAVKGDELPVYKPVPAEEQNKALKELLQTLEPDFLALPEGLLKLIPPRAYRFNPDPVETFKRHTGMSFDPLGPPEASAQLTFSLLLNPERASRLAGQQIIQADLPSFKEVLQQTTTALWKAKDLEEQSYKGQIRRLTALMYFKELMRLSQYRQLAPEASMNALEAIYEIQALNLKTTGLSLMVHQIMERYKENPEAFNDEKFLTPPDGQPIDQGYDWLKTRE